MTTGQRSNGPRARYRDEVRRNILDAARQAFSAAGYEGVSMRSLADALGLSHGTIYLYFEEKEAIFDALVHESFDQLAVALRDIPGRVRRDPVKMLKYAGRAYVRFGLENPSAYEFAFMMRRSGRAGSEPHLAYQYLRDAVKRCVEEGRFRTRDVDAASQALWTAVHGITSMLILRPSFPWAKKDRVIGMVVDHAVDGLARSKSTAGAAR